MSAEKILIVDDDRTTGKVLEMQVQKMGYTVVGVARAASEAVAMVKSEEPDLVLMDINLGRGINGIDAADTIMRAHNTPVVFVTAYADDDTLDRAKKIQPFGYINKPIRSTDLRTTITLALERARVHPPGEGHESGVSKIYVMCNGSGDVESLSVAAKTTLTKWGFESADTILPKDHRQHIANCTNQRKAQLVTGRHYDRVLSWEYVPTNKNRGVRLTITDVTEHRQLTDQNIQQASLSEVLDRLTTGIIFINENLKIFYTNKAADKVLKTNKVLTRKDGQLSCSTAVKTAELHKLVLQETGNTFTLERSRGSTPLHLLVSPLHAHTANYGHDLPIAVIYIFETVKDSDRIEDVIKTLYNLSPMEARLAAKLVLKPYLDEVAKDLGITYNTARTHIKRIYAKTNTNRLSSLVHMIVTGPVGLLIHSTE